MAKFQITVVCDDEAELQKIVGLVTGGGVPFDTETGEVSEDIEVAPAALLRNLAKELGISGSMANGIGGLNANVYTALGDYLNDRGHKPVYGMTARMEQYESVRLRPTRTPGEEEKVQVQTSESSDLELTWDPRTDTKIANRYSADKAKCLDAVIEHYDIEGTAGATAAIKHKMILAHMAELEAGEPEQEETGTPEVEVPNIHQLQEAAKGYAKRRRDEGLDPKEMVKELVMCIAGVEKLKDVDDEYAARVLQALNNDETAQAPEEDDDY